MLLPIHIRYYQQAKNPVTLPGEERWVDKWDVCVTCNSAESAAGLKKALLQIDADVLMSRGAAPPQEQQSCDKRTWVGLTDEEVNQFHNWKDCTWSTNELVRHVEATLRSKNT